MTQESNSIKMDRMRYTKDKLSANLLISAIVINCLYFVNIYQSDVGSYFYSWKIGASVIYNLVFMLAVFLASEGVKNRQSGYTPMMVIVGLMQFVRIFDIPAKAHVATITIADQTVPVMQDGQYYFLVACLAVSGVLVLVASVTSFLNNRSLASYMRSIQN